MTDLGTLTALWAGVCSMGVAVSVLLVLSDLSSPGE